MDIEFELLEKDYINFNIDHAKKSSSLKKSILSQRILGPIVFMLIPFILRLYTSIPLSYWLTIFAIASVLWVIFIRSILTGKWEEELKRC